MFAIYQIALAEVPISSCFHIKKEFFRSMSVC